MTCVTSMKIGTARMPTMPPAPWQAMASTGSSILEGTNREQESPDGQDDAGDEEVGGGADGGHQAGRPGGEQVTPGA